jgi:2-methylisocitrate lyase-like PEP mutase family enzyme
LRGPSAADHGVTLEENLAYLRSMSESVGCPSTPTERGFATTPAAAGQRWPRRPRHRRPRSKIPPILEAAVRRRACHPGPRLHAKRSTRAARGSSDRPIEGSWSDALTRRDDSPRRRRAGADCLYAPGLRTTADIKAVVDALAPTPINALVGSDFATVAELADLGVRRISVGGALARTAWTGFIQAAREIAERGTFATLAGAASFADINRSFGSE